MTPKMPTKQTKKSKMPTNFDVAPSEILRELHTRGVTLDVNEDRLVASPASRLTDELREVIRSRKPELIQFLIESHATTEALLEAAMRVCDAWGDADKGRVQMRRECLDTPQHLRADLLDYLLSQYRKDSK